VGIELNINKHINKRARIVICIVLIFLFILSIVGVLWFTKSLGSVEAAIRIVFKRTFLVLISVLFGGWISGKKIRKKYWTIIVVPVLALMIVICFVNNYPGEQIERNDILSFAGDYLSFLGTFCLGYFIFLQDEARRIDDRRSKVKLLLELIESAETDLLRLGNIVTSSNPYYPREQGGCIYPYFFTMKINDVLITDTIQEMYKSMGILNFMKESYAYCQNYEKEIREHILRSENK